MTNVETNRRVIIIGGPRRGKSTLARELRQLGIPTFCGDPLSRVKNPEPDVVYLPENLSWSEGSMFIAKSWFTASGPWVCEGVAMVRAVRKAKDLGINLDGIEIIHLTEPKSETTPGQERMAKAVDTVWRQVQENGSSHQEVAVRNKSRRISFGTF